VKPIDTIQRIKLRQADLISTARRYVADRYHVSEDQVLVSPGAKRGLIIYLLPQDLVQARPEIQAMPRQRRDLVLAVQEILRSAG